MNGELRRQNDGDWTKIEYERLIGGILIISPQEIIDSIKGVWVEMRLENEGERVGLANKYGGIVFETDETCPTCERLWKEFSEATKAHAAILGKIQLAEIEQNSTLASELGSLKRSTFDRRVKARMAVLEHDAAHQDGKAKVANEPR
jgi:hypothetical protein